MSKAARADPVLSARPHSVPIGAAVVDLAGCVGPLSGLVGFQQEQSAPLVAKLMTRIMIGDGGQLLISRNPCSGVPGVLRITLAGIIKSPCHGYLNVSMDWPPAGRGAANQRFYREFNACSRTRPARLPEQMAAFGISGGIGRGALPGTQVLEIVE